MLGIVLNLILVSLAVLALAAGTSFYVQEREAGYVRGYTLLFSIAVFFICAGYGVMGFLPYVNYAFIPRLVGLYGIDVFLLIELSFLTIELKRKPSAESSSEFSPFMCFWICSFSDGLPPSIMSAMIFTQPTKTR